MYTNFSLSIEPSELCISGAFRRGKSFLLDFLLRYLRRNGRDDWMGEKTDDKVESVTQIYSKNVINMQRKRGFYAHNIKDCV